MFNVASGLGDRFKSVVKDLEATGASLQARATQAAGPLSPDSARAQEVGTSPVKSPSFTAPAFLSDGLKRGFALGRSSMEGHTRNASADGTAKSGVATGGAATGSGQTKGPTELRDIPTSPIVETSRPSSPARFLNSSFTLGSLNSTRSPTPNPSKSPQPPSSPSPGVIPTISLPPSQLDLNVKPDPSDPATYPLPLSPSLGPVELHNMELTPKYADPLGASPILPPRDEVLATVPPVIDVKAATPDVESVSEVKTPSLESEATIKAEESQPVSVVELTKQAEEPSIDLEVLAMPAPRKSIDDEQDINKRLASSERRYEDLSQRFTTLLSQTHAANKVLKDLTQVEGGIADADAFEGWVRMMKMKVEMGADEMRRLQDKIRLQDSRIEEIRDTHRLESSSSTELVAKLRAQVTQAETKLSSEATQMLTVSQLKSELSKAQTHAKEEEEKRTKAVSLLKTLRLKNVKLEKEKEEIEKDRAGERAERSRATEDMERIKAEREREVAALRKGFEREVAGMKEKYERELGQKKGAWELDMITTKATHAKDLANKSSRINAMDATIKDLAATRQTQFDALQAKQSDLEAAQAELERHQTRTKELQYQLREAQDRCALLEEGIADQRRKDRGRPAVLGRNRENASPSPSPSRSGSANNLQTVSSAADVTRLLSEAEARSEAKLADLRAKIRSLEKERNEAEEEWARNLQDRLREVEKLRRTVQEKDGEYADSMRTRKERENMIETLECKVKEREKQINSLRAEIVEAESDKQQSDSAERAARDEIAGLHVQISTLQGQLEEAKTHAAQLKANNKTVRDELRKVQSSVQLLERQRNPGVGYWSAAGSGAPSRSGFASPESVATPSKELRRSLEHVAETQSTSRTSSPAPSERGKEEEEVNLEYLRNVILQFLENKEMRPNLVRVLSVILRFTPQELRRLNAKLLS